MFRARCMHDLSQIHAGVTEHDCMTTINIFNTSDCDTQDPYGILKDVSAITYSADRDSARERSVVRTSGAALRIDVR